MFTALKLLREKFMEHGVRGVATGFARACGVLLTLGKHRDLVKVIDGPVTQLVRARFPRVQYRYTWPYLSNRLGWMERWAALKSHYVFINAKFRPDFMTQVLGDTLSIWRLTLAEQTLSVSVQGLCAQTRHREGELTLCFKLDERAIYKLSFSVVRHDALSMMAGQALGRGPYAMFVGRIQGVSGERDAIQQATSLMGDIAPQDLLMTVLSGMATAMGIQAVIGVEDDASISNRDISKSNSSFNYEAFWSRYGAEPLPDGHVLLMLPMPEKPLTDIASKHRKRTQRKRAFKREVAACACEATRAMMASTSAPSREVLGLERVCSVTV